MRRHRKLHLTSTAAAATKAAAAASSPARDWDDCWLSSTTPYSVFVKLCVVCCFGLLFVGDILGAPAFCVHRMAAVGPSLPSRERLVLEIMILHKLCGTLFMRNTLCCCCCCCGSYGKRPANNAARNNCDKPRAFVPLRLGGTMFSFGLVFGRMVGRMLR